MAIAYRASGTFVAANATTTGAIGLPAGLANGDTLILPIHCRGGTVTTPSGYTRAAETNITAGNRLVVFYKYVTNAAGEAAPDVTHSIGGLIAGRLSAFSGCDSTTQLDVTPVTSKHADLATVTAPSVAPVSAGAMAIWIFSSGDDNTLNAATQGTTAYSSDTTTGIDGSLALVYELQTNATAVGTCAMTQSLNGPDNWNTATLILRPSVAAAADPTRDLGFDSVTYAVESAFGSSPFAPSNTWTDISAHVRAADGITVTRGRTTEFSDAQPGTMTLTLNNRARLFDPDYSAGTYFGQLLPMTRIRLRARKSSVNYPIFDGYVQSWDQGYTYPREAITTITAVDLFGRLAKRELPPSLFQMTALNDGPAAYFPFTEDPGVTYGLTADLTGNAHDGPFTGLETVDTFISEPSLKAKHVIGEVGRFGVHPFTAQGDPIDRIGTLEIWVLPLDVTEEAEASIGSPYFLVSGFAVNNAMTLNLFATTMEGPVVGAALYDATGTPVAASLFNASITVGAPLHIVATMSSNGATFTLYINGQLIDTGDTSASTFDGGTLTGVADIEIGSDVSVKFCHLATYESELTAAQVLNHYLVGVSGGFMQTVPERLDAISDFAGLTDAGLYSDTNLAANSYLTAANFSGTALEAMQTLVRTEQGRLFVDAAGVLQAQGRTADLKTLTVNAVSQATLSDSGSYAYAEIHIQPGTVDLIKNVERISVSAADVVVADAASRTQFDDLEESIGTELADPTAGRNLGLSRLRRFKDPTTRIDTITLLPHGTADVRYAFCFTVDLGWRLSATRTPQALGSALSKTVTVEGVTHTITDANWVTTLYTVPAQTVYTAQPWFVMGDATYGRFGAAAGNQLPY